MDYESYNLDELYSHLSEYMAETIPKSKNHFWNCPFCGSGEGIHGTGALKLYEDDSHFYCHKCGKYGNIVTLYLNFNHMSDTTENVHLAIKELGEKYHVSKIPGQKSNFSVKRPPKTVPRKCIGQREHIYYNADGSVFGKKTIKKYSDGSKTPFWNLYNPKTGLFDINGLKGQKAPLYHADRLHQDAETETVIFVEGEKDVETLEAIAEGADILATSTPNGASQTTWLDLYNSDLSGREIIIITDNDEAGEKYGQTVAKNLYQIAKSIKIIPTKAIWPDCPLKADISDAVEALGADEAAQRLGDAIQKAEIYTPELDKSEQASTGEQEIEYTVKRLSDVQPKPLKFIWYPYIPLGEITIMFAAGGTGKSFLTCGIAADMTAGQSLPNPYEPPIAVSKQNVLIISAEDSENILQQRLAAAGADLDRCFIIAPPDTQKELETYQPFELPCDAHDTKHINALKKAIRDHNAKLVIIDPWAAYVGKDTDMNRANSVRAITAELTVIAKEMECAFVIVAHVNKKAQADNANDAVAGSADLVNGARSALAVRTFGDTDGRVMVHTKCNYEALGKSVCYQIVNQGKGKVGKFEWNGFCELTKEDLEDAARNGKKLKDIADDKHDEVENKKTAIDIITQLAVFGKRVNVTYVRFRKLIIDTCDDNFLPNRPTRFMNSLLSELRSKGIALENVGTKIRDDFPDGTKGDKPLAGFTISCMTDEHLMAAAMP